MVGRGKCISAHDTQIVCVCVCVSDVGTDGPTLQTGPVLLPVQLWVRVVTLAPVSLQSEKVLLFDNMQCELLERIQRMEEDRQSIDISSEWWDEELRSKRSRKKWDPFRSEKKWKVPLVSGPYVVYMLRDLDILEDWTAIKKAKASISPQKRKPEVVKVEKQQYSARCEDGCLYYEGESFTKGEAIILDIKDEPPSQAIITAVSTGEVWLRRGDSSKTKIYVSQLQKGKYSVRRVGK
ncbi:hypothetical protein FKM82_020121 [Ascaphus truei]